MNTVQRTALLQEFESWAIQHFGRIAKEVTFNKIMPTNRKFRADYLLGDKVIVEINGGQYINGRHNRGGKGYENDLTKLNIAQFNGFKIYQFTYEMLAKQEYQNIQL